MLFELLLLLDQRDRALPIVLELADADRFAVEDGALAHGFLFVLLVALLLPRTTLEPECRALISQRPCNKDVLMKQLSLYLDCEGICC